ncbi:hemicentin-2 isoform X4 [Drosophila elegans]|uniref:hemicentin-2 isoform X4 n=1 Tax=Drosophila elegans TaxID=30023 RepID=UPI001BC853C9|nr:hemicentin-2 isoform X4 [Drosophila elegans]
MKIISRSIRRGALATPTAPGIRKSSQRRNRAPLKMNCPILIVISLGWLLHAHAGSGGFAVEAAISNRGSNGRSMSNVQQSAVAPSTLTATLPRFLSRGHTYRAVVGDTLVLPCQVENLGNFVLLWRRGTNVLTASNIMVTRDERVRLIDGYNLEISDLEPQDAGDYVCQISDKINRDQVHTVEILVPPSVRAIPTSGQLQARKGGPITLECKGSGNPVPSIYWTKKSGANKSTARIGDGPILTLEKLERQQAGVYQCTADNGVGDPVTVDMRLDVLCVLVPKLISDPIDRPPSDEHPGQPAHALHTPHPAGGLWQLQLRGGQLAGPLPQVHGALRTPRPRRVLLTQVGSFAGQLQPDLENR